MPKNEKIRIRLKFIIPGSALIILCLVLFFVLRRPGPTELETIDDNQFLLDTVVSIRLYDSKSFENLENAFSLIEQYESLLSRHSEDSEISRINITPSGTAVSVSEATLKLLETALDYARLSGGAFDPTVGPLVDIWGIGSESARIPELNEIDSALEIVDYTKVQIDEGLGTVLLPESGMTLDLGAIAKGWIADRTAEYLRENGEKHILLNLGGNVLVSGGKPDGKPFRIGMQDPFNDRGRYLGIFTLEDGSVVSSGIYERYFDLDGVRYHHILSTSDGYPVRNGLAAVTILSQNSVDGDALSTTVFALGLENGLDLVSSLKGIEAAFITLDGKIIMTPGAAERFEAADPDVLMEIRSP
jgi:thiamine biosynthesis lipoprotein